jgi:glc operon protein GlcG
MSRRLLRRVFVSVGGVPIIMDGKLIGAVGVSGGAGDQDGIVAKSGSTAVK